MTLSSSLSPFRRLLGHVFTMLATLLQKSHGAPMEKPPKVLILMWHRSDCFRRCRALCLVTHAGRWRGYRAPWALTSLCGLGVTPPQLEASGSHNWKSLPLHVMCVSRGSQDEFRKSKVTLHREKVESLISGVLQISLLLILHKCPTRGKP